MMEYALLTSVVITLFSLSVALYFDLRYQRIPNQLCLLTLLLGITVNSYFYGWGGLLEALYGAGLAILILIPLYYFKMLGAGDVKIMIGVGALAGPLVVTWSIMYAVIFGAFTSILIGIKAVGFKGIKMTASRYFHCFYLRTYFKPEIGDMGAVKVPYAPALTLGWMLAIYKNNDIYDLMWKVELAINELATNFSFI